MSDPYVFAAYFLALLAVAAWASRSAKKSAESAKRSSDSALAAMLFQSNAKDAEAAAALSAARAKTHAQDAERHATPTILPMPPRAAGFPRLARHEASDDHAG